MEISNNGGRPQHTAAQFAPRPQQTEQGAPSPHKRPEKINKGFLSLNTVWVVLLVGIAVLVVALIVLIVNNTVKSESSYVNKNQYQAVFVNANGTTGGQVYFGHITQINQEYIQLTNVFYLQPGSSSNQFNLNQLSCILYNPEDSMIIKTDQVLYWTNLKSSSQVTTDINKWYTDNLQCSKSASTPQGATSGSTGTTSGSATTGSTGTTTTTKTP